MGRRGLNCHHVVDTVRGSQIRKSFYLTISQRLHQRRLPLDATACERSLSLAPDRMIEFILLQRAVSMKKISIQPIGVAHNINLIRVWNPGQQR